ncbi:MAG: sulfite exporter TauE/SafE family protein [Rhodomicrobiaceae bacterium]
MELALPVGELAMLAGLLILGGAIAGTLSGLFGVGGGGILVPVLYELFGAMGTPDDVRMHIAVGTSFAIIVPTSFRAARSHYKRASIDMPILRLLASWAVVGVVLGAITAKYANGDAMKIVWVVSACILSISLLLKEEILQFKADVGKPAIGAPIGAGIGLIATLMGVGGGAQIAILLRMFGRAIHVAVGTAAGFSAIIAVPALLGFIWAGWGSDGLPVGSLGYVSLIGAGAMIPASVLFAPLGVRLAHGLPRRKLEVVFALFLLLVGFRFLMALVY